VTEAGAHKVIAEVDWDSAFTTVHKDAIYMVESQQYHVENLDLEAKKAYVKKCDVDHYTDAMTYTNVRVIDVFAEKKAGRIIVEHGEVQVVRKVVGYKKIKFYTSENLGFGEVTLPEKDMHTTSYWFTIPRNLLKELPYNEAQIIDGLSGLAYCLNHLSAMILMADIRDIDKCIGDKSGEWFVRHGKGGRMLTHVAMDEKEKSADQPGTMIDAFDPTVFIFDAYPGGIGFSELLFDEHNRTLQAAGNLIRQCGCDHGCPSCVGPSLEVGPLAKEAALSILDLIMT
jgi:DEAD/DEAH box helicase domain-containing protein